MLVRTFKTLRSVACKTGGDDTGYDIACCGPSHFGTVTWFAGQGVIQLSFFVHKAFAEPNTKQVIYSRAIVENHDLMVASSKAPGGRLWLTGCDQVDV